MKENEKKSKSKNIGAAYSTAVGRASIKPPIYRLKGDKKKKSVNSSSDPEMYMNNNNNTIQQIDPITDYTGAAGYVDNKDPINIIYITPRKKPKMIAALGENMSINPVLDGYTKVLGEHEVSVLAPNGSYISTSSIDFYFTYSTGRKAVKLPAFSFPAVTNHSQQEKAKGVWQYENEDGQFQWDHMNSKYVKNTSHQSAGQNSFPGLGKQGTTYAGGDNPLNLDDEDGNYSQPPQNLADYAGKIHDLHYDSLDLKGEDDVWDEKATIPNNNLMALCDKIMKLYKDNQKGISAHIDPFTGAPISPQTYDVAVYMKVAFEAIEIKKYWNIKLIKF